MLPFFLQDSDYSELYPFYMDIFRPVATSLLLINQTRDIAPWEIIYSILRILYDDVGCMCGIEMRKEKFIKTFPMAFISKNKYVLVVTRPDNTKRILLLINYRNRHYECGCVDEPDGCGYWLLGHPDGDMEKTYYGFRSPGTLSIEPNPFYKEN